MPKLTLNDICQYRNENMLSTDLSDNVYISTETMQPNREGISSSDIVTPTTKKVKAFYPGDILVSNIRPYFKKIWRATFAGGCSNDVLVFSPKCNSEYLYWLLSTDSFFNYMMATSKGTKMPRGDKKAIMKYIVPDHSDKEQRQIASFLNPLQNKIALNNRINDYLAETAVALFNRECSQSNEPNAMLSDIAQITMGQSPSGSSYNEEGDGEVFYQGRAEFGAFFPRRRLFTTKPKRMAQEGDTLMSVRAPVGDLNIANENCCIGRGLAAIHSENNQSFVHYLVRAQRRILNTFNGDGTVFGSINGKALKELPVFLPGNDVIAHLESQLKSIDELIRRNDDEMQALEQMRDTLLPRLMSGEIDVSQIEVPKQLNNHLCDYS